MRPVKITFGNELAQVPIVRATVQAFAQAAGGSLNFARQMELVVEEMLTNIFKFEYLPGQREELELELGQEGRDLIVIIRFKGIPFDLEYLKRCAQVSLEDVLDGRSRGLGLLLMKQFTDKLEYRNLGQEGQVVRITRQLDKGGPGEAEADQADLPLTPEPLSGAVQIRRMLPEEAAGVSKLAYFAYDYTYINAHIYDPEQVRNLNQKGEFMSYLALDPENGDIVGHCALVPDQRTGLDELGIAFVNPFYRGGGCLKALTEHILEEVLTRGSEGVFVMAVVAHDYSQRAAHKFHLRETALVVSRLHPIGMRQIRQARARESLMFMARLLKNQQRGPYHAPPAHRDMLEQIYAQLGAEVTWARSQEGALPARGRLELMTDKFLCGHIQVEHLGTDTPQEVQQQVLHWCLDRLETIYLYLPLQDAGTALLCPVFEAMGFFFAGLMPARGGQDLLLLQYLNNQRYNYGDIQAGTAFGRQLLAYVHQCDPNAGPGGAQ